MTVTPGAPEAGPASGGIRARLLSRNAAVLLARNTLVSCGAFALSLGLMWLLVRSGVTGKLTGAAIGFVAANTLHYLLGRSWIYRGTRRGLVAGYAYFLINGGLGLLLTLGLFAAFLRFTAINYLLARVLVSVIAGLAMFLLNAGLNFRRL